MSLSQTLSPARQAEARRLRASLVRLVAARLFQAVVVALIVGIIGFAMMQALPGDAAYRIAAGRYGYDMADAAAAEAVRTQLGLDRPAFEALLLWIGHALTFDLGNSFVTGAPVAGEIAHQLGHSVELALASVLVALVVAVPIGTYAGLHPGGLFDRIASGGALVLRATPTFLIAVLLILLVAVELGLAPASGHGHGSHFILPALTLGLALASVLSRVVRNAVVDAVSSEAFRFARQKGLPLFVALRRHALRNAAVPVITYLGVQTALLVEGVVVVESVFSWPGIGHALTHAIFERDVPMLQGTALVLGLGFVLLSFLVDLTCRFIDPRLAE